MLPTANPISAVTFNYTPIVVLGTLVILVVWWMVSVRYWFKGPKIQGSESELDTIESSFATPRSDVEGAAGD